MGYWDPLKGPQYWDSYGNGNSLIVAQKYGFLDSWKTIQASLIKLDMWTGGELDYARHVLLLSNKKPMCMAWNWCETDMHL